MFGLTTEEKLPEEFITSYPAWDNYVSNIWRDLFVFTGISARDIVVEIAPGTSTKIGLALSKLHFAGELYVVEPVFNVLETVVSKYQNILPAARIHPIQTTLALCHSHLPTKADLLVSNHPLDDMLLAAGSTEEDFSKLFEWGEGSHFAQILSQWNEFKNKPHTLLTAHQKVYYDWKDILRILNPANFILCQYPSITLTNHSLGALNVEATKILETIKTVQYYSTRPQEDIQAILNKHKNYNDAHIGKAVLNAANWVISQKRP
jgi:hypothetical protein